MSSAEPAKPLQELIARSNRLGSDRRNTNYGGGNTSAKGVLPDPVSGEDVNVMWIKGSGGDLATLTEGGVSVLQLDRARALEARYESIEQEDELHQMLDYCGFGPPGAAPSIDTSMHALLPADHVDHLHPDSVIALAACADGEALTAEVFGGDIGWVPWQRPGFDLALKIEALRAARPSLRGVVMGGHGLSTWAGTSDECEQFSLDAIGRAAEFIESRGRQEPLGPTRAGFEALDAPTRQKRALELFPVIRGLASTDRAVIGRWFDDDNVLDFIGRESTPRLAPLGTSCPDHFIRTKVRPLLLDLPSGASIEDQVSRLGELHSEYRQEYRQYYDRYAGPETPPIRGSDPAIFLIPGLGMFSFGIDLATAQVAGEFYINAINVIRGAEAVSTYTPVPESEKFGVEYWLLEDLKLRRRPAPKPLTGKVAVVTDSQTAIGEAVVRWYEQAGAVVVAVEQVEPADVDVALDDAVLRFGGVDIAVGIGTGVVASAAQAVGAEVLLIGDEAMINATISGLTSGGIRANGVAATTAAPDVADDVARAALALVDGSLSRANRLIIPVAIQG